ncbi:MAG TPA: efflux RND transporter periplasmic adaptor subunit [Tepidisphaeraceae bacterium]
MRKYWLVLFSGVLSLVVAVGARGQHDDHDHGAQGEKGHAHSPHGEEGHKDEVKLTAEAIARHGIKLEPATRRMLASTISVAARVSFDMEAMAHVGSAVQGRATEIKVRAGDAVKKGDELVVVESPALGEAQSDFLQKRTAVAVSSAAVEPAKDAAERAKKLYDQNQGIALGEVQKRQSELRAAQGAIQTAEAAATAAENRLHLLGMDQKSVDALVKTKQINPQHVIRAPIAGRVIAREVTLGELVAPEKEALLVLADLSKVWVIADVPEGRLKDVSTQTAAQVQIPAVGEQAIAGKVSFVAPALDPNTRTAQVRIEVANSEGKLKPGMFATAVLSSGQGGNADAVLAVPDEAVQTVEGGPGVFVPVEGEANTFALRPVKARAAVGGFIPIIEGLKEGEQVVVSGSFILKAELGKHEAGHEH